MANIQTLKEFKEKYDLEKISAIYICDNETYKTFSKLYNSEYSLDDIKLFYNNLKNNNENIIFKDCFLKEENGKIETDMDQIFKKYKNYMILGLFPVVKNFNPDANNTFESMMENATSYNLLIKKVKKIPEIKIVSDIDGYCVFDMVFFKDDAITEDDEALEGALSLCAIFNNDSNAYEYMKKRKMQYSAFCKIKKGKPIYSSMQYFITTRQGELEEIEI